MIDTQILGQQAARCMEALDEDEFLDGGKVIACAVVVIAQNDEGDITQTRTFMSDTLFYQQLGLMHAGISCVENGFRMGSPDELEDEEDE